MFCIIEGRNFRKMAPGQALPETPYLRGFTLYLLYSIVSFLSISVLPVAFFVSIIQLHFLFWCFLHFHSFYSIHFFHSTTFFHSNPRSFKKAWSSPFGRIFRRNRLFAIFLIQPVFLERPSLCAKNSGWIWVFWPFLA